VLAAEGKSSALVSLCRQTRALPVEPVDMKLFYHDGALMSRKNGIPSIRA
jgi:hypothetical protein